jgi:hypothetical protein
MGLGSNLSSEIHSPVLKKTLRPVGYTLILADCLVLNVAPCGKLNVRGPKRKSRDLIPTKGDVA